MRVLIIRHGRAEDRPSSPGALKHDAARRLTPSGRKDMRQVARGLHRIAPAIDVLAASPLVRAGETAEIVGRVFDGAEPIELQALAPGGAPKALLKWLAQQPSDATVALVGHEPDLSRLAGLLLAGRGESFLDLKKGAACLVEFDGRPKPGAGRLLWALAPGQLRRLAGCA